MAASTYVNTQKFSCERHIRNPKLTCLCIVSWTFQVELLAECKAMELPNSAYIYTEHHMYTL